jgi:SAM-dependent methyltransferase
MEAVCAHPRLPVADTSVGRADAAAQDQWLEVGAAEKADSVRRLTAGLEVERLLEVGCGSGAVLQRLADSHLARSVAGLEPSLALCAIAKSRTYATAAEVECGTLLESPFASQRFGLIVLTHVLEHTPDPVRLLGDCLGRGEYVFVEVPLEGTISGDIRAWIRRVLTGRRRTDNQAGHVQFFSGGDITRMAHWCGARVIAQHVYFPQGTYEVMLANATGWRRLYYRGVLAAHRILGDRLTAALYYGHSATLLRLHDGATDASAPHPFYWRPTK